MENPIDIDLLFNEDIFDAVPLTLQRMDSFNGLDDEFSAFDTLTLLEELKYTASLENMEDTDNGSLGSNDHMDMEPQPVRRPRIYTMEEPLELKKLDEAQLKFREEKYSSEANDARHKHRKGTICPRCTIDQKLKQVRRVILKRSGLISVNKKKSAKKTTAIKTKSATIGNIRKSKRAVKSENLNQYEVPRTA